MIKDGGFVSIYEGNRLVSGKMDFAIGLLSKKKQGLFTIKKKVVTSDDITRAIHKAYASITKRDFNKFLKEIQGSKADQEVYSEDSNGFASYLYMLAIESGLYSLSLDKFVESIEQTGKAFNRQKYEPIFAGRLYSIGYKYASEIFPAGHYGKTLQGVMLNELTRMGKRAEVVDEDNSLAYIGKQVKLVFYHRDNNVAMTTPTQKVLSMLQEDLCKAVPKDPKKLGKVTLEELGKYSKQRITLDKYLELTKVKDKKEARKTIKEACDNLFDIAFSVRVKQGKELKEYKGRLFQSQMISYRGGIYEMEFSNDFLRYCATTTPSAFHPGMYQINGNKFRYAWSIGQKLRQHYELNRGESNANRLSVRKLLEAVPDIPTYDEVMQGDKHVDRRIIEPVERDLNELQRLGVLKSWEYSNAKGAELTKEQADTMDYDTWSKLYITFKLDLPPQDHYIEQHKKKIDAAKKRAAAKQTNSK